MSFFQKISAAFKNAFGRKKKDDQWASNFTHGTPNNNLPLEPEKDPWRT
jgi:hypothetical protein